jgi:hypothetical protein
MRIPIYPADLNPQKGFKRIAKVIHRDWPGPDPVNLSAAREILARCVGYQNYHDVTRSADKWPDNAPAPEVEDLRAAILVALANKLHAESLSNSVDIEKLTAFVERLPLNVLQTYRLSRADRPER